MKLIKPLAYINVAALTINGIMLWLMLVRNFPPILGMALFVTCLAGAVWFSCYVNGALPKRGQPTSFYSAPTEKIETI